MLDTVPSGRRAVISGDGEPVLDYGSELASIERAVISTVTYRDLFDYPVRPAEIHRYLHDLECDLDEVTSALANQEFVRDYLCTDGEFFALKGREELFVVRREREKIAAELWPRAIRHAANLASLPFVRMIAVTGSLACNNPTDDADIDVMIVTDSGRLWTARSMAKLLQLLDQKFGRGEICVNHLVSTSALALEFPSLYVAQELAQMVPLYGHDVYTELRSHNLWMSQFLPNAAGPPPIAYDCQARLPRLRSLATTLIDNRAGMAFEHWESGRKIHKYNETGFLLGRTTPFRREATGHRRNVKRNIEAAFQDRLKGPRERRQNLRVLIGQAYHLRFDAKLWRSMQPYAPLGSLYAAACVRSLGHDVRVFDSMLSIYDGEWPAAVQINNPDVVVLFEDNFNYLTKMCLLSMRDVALKMIGIAKQRGALVLVCSSDSADHPDVYLDAGADFVLIGEGEETLKDVLTLIEGKSALGAEKIAGIAFVGSDGDLVKTQKRAVIRHIDNLPLPAWDLIDLARYQDIWTRRHRRFSLNLVTTRGCPYHCNWCAKPIWGQRYNARSPKNVVDEIVWLKELVDFDHIWFMDDIFGLKPRWIRKFASELDAAGITIRFKCLSRPDLLQRDGEIEALAQAGCETVWMGAESGSQNILNAMEKGTTVETIEASSAALKARGIRVGMFIQFGYPGETRADIRATVKMLRRSMPDELGISVSYPLPGTAFFDRVEAELGSTRNWTDSNDLAMLYNGPFSTRFYRALHRYVHSDIAMRRAWQTVTNRNLRASLGGKKLFRKFLLIPYSAAMCCWFAWMMSILARSRPGGLQKLPIALDQREAATPSEQAVD